MALGGAGQKAGLLEGDVVMEVNGQNVEDKSLEDVIMLVKEGGHSLSLLVMDRTSYDKSKETDTPTRDATDSEVHKYVINHHSIQFTPSSVKTFIHL